MKSILIVFVILFAEFAYANPVLQVADAEFLDIHLLLGASVCASQSVCEVADGVEKVTIEIRNTADAGVMGGSVQFVKNTREYGHTISISVYKRTRGNEPYYELNIGDWFTDYRTNKTTKVEGVVYVDSVSDLNLVMLKNKEVHLNGRSIYPFVMVASTLVSPDVMHDMVSKKVSNDLTRKINK